MIDNPGGVQPTPELNPRAEMASPLLSVPEMVEFVRQTYNMYYTIA
jgi:hypothetical protein